MTPSSTLQSGLVFHGYAASPDDHWFGWLVQRLSAIGIPTTVPALPDSLSPDPARWQETIRDAVGEPDAGTLIVAHSLGCLAVIRHLASLTGAWRLGGLVLVSGFMDPLPALPELDQFIGDGCDITGLAERIDRISLIRSDDDPLVPPAHTDRLAGLLGATARVVPGAGHFLGIDGHTTLPAALDAITS